MSLLSTDRPSSSSGSGKTEDEPENNDDDLELDNTKSVLLKIATLYADQLMSDLILVVGGISYPAHRLILCVHSEVLQVMVMNREWSESQEKRITLQETASAASVFSHFLKYFYTGQIRISNKTVLPVLSLADKYNVKDLIKLCLDYMSQHITQAAQKGQLIAWMQYAMASAHNEVANACMNFLKWNWEWIWWNDEFVDLEGENLVYLLQQSDIVINNEMSLYLCVERWLTSQKERLGLSKGKDNSYDSSEMSELKAREELVVSAVFSHIRFPMMSLNQLARLLLSPFILEHKDFFVERIAVAMNYQSGQHERVSEIQHREDGKLLFTPRLYTDDTWGSFLTVQNFHAMPFYHTRTFIFATKPTMCDVGHQDKMTEWTVDLYPKGVWFRKSMLIAWAGTVDVPESVLRTVRISITCQNVAPSEPDRPAPDVRVKIGILVWGIQNEVEHISVVVERVHRFCAQERVFNIDNALDFDELNTPLYRPSYPSVSTPSESHGRCPKCVDNSVYRVPPYLLGPNRDQLKMQIVIVPLTDYSYIGPTSVTIHR